ncbi:MAG: hydantoinase B/oxoprolinase family protein [Desulfovibrio sp.]
MPPSRTETTQPVSPVQLEIFKNRFASIAEEMGVTLTRTAFSPNIKERRDLSCALFDARGNMVAQAAHIPVHLGSMPLSVRAVMDEMDELKLGPGDMVMLNDPYRGGTHLPDITLVAPIYAPGETRPAFFAANRAHHADVGGMSGGSMPLSSSLFQEGLIIPPVKLLERGRIVEPVLRLVLANVRTPAERRGDFEAQIMANQIGIRRLGELLASHGTAILTRLADALADYSEALLREVVGRIPDGSYEFSDALDDDGQGNGPLAIRLRLSIAGSDAVLDFTSSADQTPGCVNAVRAITLSAVLYAFLALARSLFPQRTPPANAGCLRPLTVRTRPGSLLDARFPAAVAGGNVETSQRIVDVVLGALAKALPEIVPAASQGTMNNLTMAGSLPRRMSQRMNRAMDKPMNGESQDDQAFAYYETLAGGMGGGPRGPGESALHSHMTNTLNTPVEALEFAYPLRVTRFGLRSNSGGAGKHPGGRGLVREIMALAPCEATLLTDRRSGVPYGLQGGGPGTPGRNLLLRPYQEQDQTTARAEEELPGKAHVLLRPGDALRMETPGGGGWGAPETTADSPEDSDMGKE